MIAQMPIFLTVVVDAGDNAGLDAEFRTGTGDTGPDAEFCAEAGDTGLDGCGVGGGALGAVLSATGGASSWYFSRKPPS